MFLLDECLWPGLANAIPGFSCRTVAEEGWLGATDIELIANARGTFDAILTSDRRFGRGVDLSADDPAIVILRPRLDRPDHLVALAGRLMDELTRLVPGTCVEVRWWD